MRKQEDRMVYIILNFSPISSCSLVLLAFIFTQDFTKRWPFIAGNSLGDPSIIFVDKNSEREMALRISHPESLDRAWVLHSRLLHFLLRPATSLQRWPFMEALAPLDATGSGSCDGFTEPRKEDLEGSFVYG